MADDRLLPPPVFWAQRKNLLYVKIQLEDCRNPTIKVEKDKIYFKGRGGTENKDHEVTLELFKEIKPEDSKYSVKGIATEFVLIKAEENFWKRLLKEDKKFHWLKVDFNKWKDEDDSEDEVEGTDFEEMMRKMEMSIMTMVSLTVMMKVAHFLLGWLNGWSFMPPKPSILCQTISYWKT